jgi:hypothetical protein
MPNLLVTALNAGELSPYMDARTDVEKYRTGCRRLENMIVLPYGGVYRRAGTEYLGEAKLGNKRCRLIGFNFSVTTRFVLELGDEYLRVWGNNGPVLSGGTPLELASPIWRPNCARSNTCRSTTSCIWRTPTTLRAS